MLVAVAAAVSNAIRAADHLHALTEETSKLQAVVDHGTDGVAVLAPQGEILVWSPAMTRLTGTDATANDGALGVRPVCQTQDDAVIALLARLGGADTNPAEVARALSAGPAPARVVITVRGDDAERRDLEISVARITDGSQTGELVVLTARDVTEAGRLERLKADFIASVSHELRTPITPIEAYAQLLATRGHRMEPARRLHALQLIEDRADHLSRLVDDLLLASRVGGAETSQITIEPTEVDLRTVVDKSLTTSLLLIGRTNSTVPAHPVVVLCDPVRVVQCLSNLLSNAVKYSPADSPIHIEINETDSLASVSVTDSGRGIPSAEMERVFERFHRVDDAFTMQTSGSGLGLYIARELARAMGGDITLVSQLGHGSTATLSLPRPGAEDHANPSTPARRPVPEEARR
jgi:signal transduction histidine kinase